MKSKKDLNYIAKVEQAISKKYGDEAVQNPSQGWDEEKEKEYLEQLKEIGQKKEEKAVYEEKVEKNGFFVSKKLFMKDTNRVCPVCEKYSFKSKDDVYMNKFDCCFNCYVEYVEEREERWKTGWRPENGRK